MQSTWIKFNLDKHTTAPVGSHKTTEAVVCVNNNISLKSVVRSLDRSRKTKKEAEERGRRRRKGRRNRSSNDLVWTCWGRRRSLNRHFIRLLLINTQYYWQREQIINDNWDCNLFTPVHNKRRTRDVSNCDGRREKGKQLNLISTEDAIKTDKRSLEEKPEWREEEYFIRWPSIKESYSVLIFLLSICRNDNW